MWFSKKPDDALWEETNKKVLGLARAKQFDEALAVAQELYEYSRKGYGKKHQKTVKAINNLGYILTQKRDFDGAESYLLMALQICEKIYGKFSKEVAFVNVNLARLYKAKAEEIFDMEDSYREVYGHDEHLADGNLAGSY
jgi:tetratricopeptide (TPR) repeat protein